MARKKKGVFNVLSESLNYYIKNLELSLPFLFLGIFFLILITLIFFSTIGVVSYSIKGQVQELMLSDMLNMANISFLIILLIISFIAIIFVSSYFISGAIGMSLEVVNKKKASIKTMFKIGNKFWLSFSGLIILIISLIGLISVIPFFLLILTLLILPLMPLTIIVSIAIIFSSYIFLSTAPYFLIIKDEGILKSIRYSFNFAKKNYWNIFLVLLIFFLLESIINIIPLGNIIIFLVISPLQILAFLLLIKHSS